MNKFKFLFILTSLSLFLFSTEFQVYAQDKDTSLDKKPVKLHKLPANKISNGTVSINGKKVAYKAEAGTLALTDRKNERDTTARMSFVAYFKEGKNTSKRPVTFIYNGGPGSSTLWLHMGSIGPKWVKTDTTEHLSGAPYELVDNKYSILDESDLVFIDMPGTGFGRIKKGKESDYHSVDNDAAAFAQFIQNFITKYDRWNSPKFLFGESYGTLRSALVANILQSRHNIDVNGVILLSQILDYANSVDGPKRHPGNNKPYELGLPTYAATAWYHDKLSSKHNDLETFLKEVEEFALGDYARALDKGARLEDTELNQVAEKLHEYIGLPVDYIKKANLRIQGGEFRQQLLKDEGEIPGRLGTRFRGPIIDPLAQSAYGDPQSDALSSAYVSLLNDYMRNDLGYGGNLDYRVSVYRDMDWKSKHKGSPGTVNVINDLAKTMKKNPNLKILLTAGYYDLATPYFQGIYELEQLPISKKLQENIDYKFYESGHMVYVHKPSLKKLSEDLREFIKEN